MGEGWGGFATDETQMGWELICHRGAEDPEGWRTGLTGGSGFVWWDQPTAGFIGR